jgi:hypothetical protein
MNGDPDWYHIWEQVTLTLMAGIALLGFLRGLEHRKDSNFRELAQSLADPQSPVLRASAAAQLASYATYRRYFIFGRPYRKATFMLVLSALKKREKEQKEHKHVRQQLAYSLRHFLPNMVLEKDELFDLIDAQMDELILHHFPLNNCDLTGAILQKSDLGEANFTNSKLWKADFFDSKCAHANFSHTKLWDANFEKANLQGANFDGAEFNENTRFQGASLADAKLSDELRNFARKQGAINL